MRRENRSGLTRKSDKNLTLYILIDAVVKLFSTARAEIDTLLYKGHVKALCMNNLIHEVIIGNIPGPIGSRQHGYDTV